MPLQELSSVSPKRGFLKGFLVSAFFLLIVVVWVPIRYEANDDLGLIARFSEQSGFRPDPLQPTVSASLGVVLSSLYGSFPEVPWYGLLIYASAFVGISLTMSVLFRSAQGASGFLALPLLCLLFFHVLAFASFTAAALLLECAVFLCVMEWIVRGRCPAGNPRWYAGALALAFLVGFLLRWRLVLYAAVFGVPILFFVRKGQLRNAVPLIVAVGLLMTGDRLLFHAMGQEAHREFLEYNLLRMRFHDTVQGEHHGEVTEEALRKVGWTREDYAFYKSWILYDHRQFNTRTLRTFLEANELEEKEPPWLLGWKKLRRQFHLGNHYTFALVFAFASLLIYRLGDLLQLSVSMRWRIFLALAFIGAGILYVVCFRFVPRVFIPLYAYFFGTVFLLFHLNTRTRGGPDGRRVRAWILAPCATALCLLTGWQAYGQATLMVPLLKRSKAEKAYIQKALSAVRDVHAVRDPLLVLMNPVRGLGAEYVDPLKEFSDFTELRIMPAGWGVHSPRFNAILEDMGLPDGRAFLAWMIDNPKVLLVLRARGGMDTWRWRSLWESYFSRRIAPDRRPRLVPVHDFRNADGAGLVFFSMRSAR
jgi:hypothetical protein